MASERWTEAYVLNKLGLDLTKTNDGLIVEAQKSDDSSIQDILKKCGGKPTKCEIDEYNKKSSKKAGQPEFIIRFLGEENLIILVECKQDIKNHISKDLNKPNKCAVDGVLYYAKYFKDYFDVITIAVSGDCEEDIKVSTHIWHKNSNIFEDKDISSVLDINEYKNIYKGNKYKSKYSIEDVRRIALDFHDELRELGFTEKEKPLFVAGLLIALSDKDFRNMYMRYSKPGKLLDDAKNTLQSRLKESGIPIGKINIVSRNFDVITKNQKLRNMPLDKRLSALHFIKILDNSILPMMKDAGNNIDVAGEFYNEFIKYTGGDGKGLGIVLTPRHITELFCELAEIDKSSKVIDICCGTGSFLVAAMHKMLEGNLNDDERESIFNKQLYGIEINSDLYTMACANMIVRGDGHSKLKNLDCFSKEVTKELTGICNVGLINPPYSQKDCELKFIERMLDLLTIGGIGIAIVPMSSAIGTKFKTERNSIMSKHRLLAVMSMPEELFYPVGVNTCIMVWKAHNKHDKLKHKTWFGYWKNDGFEKMKKLGRVDLKNNWSSIKEEWIRMYINKDVIDGMSAYEYVDANDEWLCEAYMKTDYSNLTELDFEKAIKEYLAYLIKNGDGYESK
ncbi:HsdM family class I SAM-dependent methyltransferase [Clostridium perfringens]